MSCTTVIEDVTLDANILVYAVDQRDVRKLEIAKQVIEACGDANCCLPLQALNEFFRATTKNSLRLPHEGRRLVELCQRSMRIVPASEEDLVEAMNTYERLGLQFFDALLVATALRAGCTTLFSEDMQHERVYNGLQVVNPFSLDTDELDKLLL